MKRFKTQFFTKNLKTDYTWVRNHRNLNTAVRASKELLRRHNRFLPAEKQWALTRTNEIAPKNPTRREHFPSDESWIDYLMGKRLKQLHRLKQNLAEIRKLLRIPYANQKTTIEKISKLKDDLMNARDSLSFLESMTRD